MRTLSIIIFLTIILFLCGISCSPRVPGVPRIVSQDVYMLVDTSQSLGSIQDAGINETARDDRDGYQKNDIKNNLVQSSVDQSSYSELAKIDNNVTKLRLENMANSRYLIDVEIMSCRDINAVDLCEILDKNLILINTSVYMYKLSSFEEVRDYILNDFGCHVENFDRSFKDKYYLEYRLKDPLFTWEKVGMEDNGQLYEYLTETLGLPWADKKNIKIIKSRNNIKIYYNESVLLKAKKLFYNGEEVGTFNNFILKINNYTEKLNINNVKNAKDPDLDKFLKILRNNLKLKIAKKKYLNIIKKDEPIYFNFSDNIDINKTESAFCILSTKERSNYELISKKTYDLNDKKYIWTQVFPLGQTINVQAGPLAQGQILKYSYIVEPKTYGTQRIATIIELNNKKIIKKISELNTIDPGSSLNISIDTRNSKVHKNDKLKVEYLIKQNQAILTNIKIDFEGDGKNFEYKDKNQFQGTIETEVGKEPFSINRNISYLEEGEYRFPWIKVNDVIYDFKETQVQVEDLFPDTIQALIAIILAFTILTIIFGNIYGKLIYEKTKTTVEPYAITVLIILVIITVALVILILYRIGDWIL